MLNYSMLYANGWGWNCCRYFSYSQYFPITKMNEHHRRLYGAILFCIRDWVNDGVYVSVERFFSFLSPVEIAENETEQLYYTHIRCLFFCCCCVFLLFFFFPSFVISFSFLWISKLVSKVKNARCTITHLNHHHHIYIYVYNT